MINLYVEAILQPVLQVTEMLERLSIPRASAVTGGLTANWFMLMLWHSVISVMLRPLWYLPVSWTITPLLTKIQNCYFLYLSLRHLNTTLAREQAHCVTYYLFYSWYFSKKDLSGNNLSWEMINWSSKAAGYSSNIVNKI